VHDVERRRAGKLPEQPASSVFVARSGRALGYASPTSEISGLAGPPKIKDFPAIPVSVAGETPAAQRAAHCALEDVAKTTPKVNHPTRGSGMSEKRMGKTFKDAERRFSRAVHPPLPAQIPPAPKLVCGGDWYARERRRKWWNVTSKNLAGEKTAP